MAYHQNTSVDNTKLIVGNCKIETAPSAGDTFVNLGAGIVNSFVYAPTMYDVQAGNAPDPIEGVSYEEATIDFELLEYDASVLNAIGCGMFTMPSATTVLSTLTGGGNQTVTKRAFRITNTRMISGATKETVCLVYSAYLSTGLTINFKDDNDSNPLAVLPGTITAKVDSSRTAGSQLFSIQKALW
jgi:hypothetical protein